MCMHSLIIHMDIAEFPTVLLSRYNKLGSSFAVSDKMRVGYGKKQEMTYNLEPVLNLRNKQRNIDPIFAVYFSSKDMLLLNHFKMPLLE